MRKKRKYVIHSGVLSENCSTYARRKWFTKLSLPIRTTLIEVGFLELVLQKFCTRCNSALRAALSSAPVETHDNVLTEDFRDVETI